MARTRSIRGTSGAGWAGEKASAKQYAEQSMCQAAAPRHACGVLTMRLGVARRPQAIRTHAAHHCTLFDIHHACHAICFLASAIFMHAWHAFAKNSPILPGGGETVSLPGVPREDGGPGPGPGGGRGGGGRIGPAPMPAIMGPPGKGNPPMGPPGPMPAMPGGNMSMGPMPPMPMSYACKWASFRHHPRIAAWRAAL